MFPPRNQLALQASEQLFLLCCSQILWHGAAPRRADPGARSQNPNNCSCARTASSRKPEVSSCATPGQIQKPEQFIGFAAARLGKPRNPNKSGASSRQGKRPDPEGAGPKPEQIVQPAARNPDSRSPKSSPPRPHGVFWVLLVFFAIFCYLDHIIRLWCNVLHPTLCHTLKLGKFFKHLLPIHLRYILMHNVAFINQ